MIGIAPRPDSPWAPRPDRRAVPQGRPVLRRPLSTRPAALALAALCLVAIAATAVRAQTSSSGDPAAFRFDWPVPGRAAVVQTRIKDGRRAVLHYNLSIRQADSPSLLRVAFEDMQVMSLLGRDMTTPEARAQLAQVAPLLSVIPSFLINRDGALERVVGIPEVIERLKQTLPDRANPQVWEAMQSPAMIAAMERKSADYWNLWVGTWAGLELAPGESVSGTDSVPMISGEPVAQQFVVRHLGADPACAACVRLRLETTLDGPRFAAALARSLPQFAADPDDVPMEQLAAMFKSARRTALFEVVTDARTLRPQTAKSEFVTAIVPTSGAPVSRVDTSDYTFDWQ